MYKLVLFATLLACTAAAPGLIGAPYGIAAPISPWGHGLVSAPIVKAVAPVATSYSNSVRIASPALVAAPAYASHAYAAPAYASHYAAPAYASPYAAPAYTSHYAAPAYASPYAAPVLSHGW